MVLPFLRQTAKRQCHGSVCVQPFLRFFIVSLPSIGLLRIPDRMPCSDAEKLALKAFLGQKRGMRKLISSTHPGRRGFGMCARAGACGCLAVCVCAVCCATALPTRGSSTRGEDPLALDGVQWLATGPERTMCVPVVGPERTWCAPGFALLAGRSPMLFSMSKTSSSLPLVDGPPLRCEQ